MYAVSMVTDLTYTISFTTIYILKVTFSKKFHLYSFMVMLGCLQ